MLRWMLVLLILAIIFFIIGKIFIRNILSKKLILAFQIIPFIFMIFAVLLCILLVTVILIEYCKCYEK